MSYRNYHPWVIEDQDRRGLQSVDGTPSIGFGCALLVQLPFLVVAQPNFTKRDYAVIK